ncbi:MAG: hypothetical protein ACR2LQ_02985 [Acidimicrobiales bacterium]
MVLASVVHAGRAAAEEPGAAPRLASGAVGDQPESALQGEVTAADRSSGRSERGYGCNLTLSGQLPCHGASWVDPTYGHCAYVEPSLAENLTSLDPGVRVIDVSDPAHPVQTATLASTAMRGDTWESMRVNQSRGLLAGVAVGPAAGVAFFDVYDVAADCAHPRLLNSVAGTSLSLPANVVGHEGGFSPDGMTYWSSGFIAGSVTAIDVTDPSLPHAVWTGSTGLISHGFDISSDGNRMYDDWDTYDRTMADERRAAVLLDPHRAYAQFAS